MMTLMSGVKERLAARLRPVIHSEVDKTLEVVLPQLLDFLSSAPEARQSYHDPGSDPVGNYPIYVALRDRLEHARVRVEDLCVDFRDFAKWRQAYPEVDAAYRRLGEAWIEKCLEHYLSFTLLGLSATDIFVDVAAAGSPFSAMLRHRLGLRAYRLDLAYPRGIHGHDIGADAGDTGLPGGFATALALHCAYECFSGDADVRFVHEAARILRPGGRYIVLPLYLADTYFVSTSPYCSQREVTIDPGATKLWRDDSYKMPFARHYSPESFAERIFSLVPGNMSGTVYFLKNLPDVSRSFAGQKIYCYFVFLCSKTV